jgi:hypothetical protein
MHRALNILEVVDVIISYLSWRFAKEERAALAALATTCRMFHDPALDALWRTQTTLKRLLSCMPVDLFNISPMLARAKRPLVRNCARVSWIH